MWSMAASCHHLVFSAPGTAHGDSRMRDWTREADGGFQQRFGEHGKHATRSIASDAAGADSRAELERPSARDPDGGAHHRDTARRYKAPRASTTSPGRPSTETDRPPPQGRSTGADPRIGACRVRQDDVANGMVWRRR